MSTLPIRAFRFAHFRYYLTHANTHLSFYFNLMFQLHQILSMLSARDICQFSMGNKRTLDICYGNKLWAQLYYQRCDIPNTMLYIMDHPGPLRVRATSGKLLIFGNIPLHQQISLSFKIVGVWRYLVVLFFCLLCLCVLFYGIHTLSSFRTYYSSVFILLILRKLIFSLTLASMFTHSLYLRLFIRNMELERRP